ncbi:uridine kinase [Thiofilum flexile]|uniref:uridine kinase n=1 Tax=Thiofilum flexile TaxID=125627 RepID=UPI000363D6BF|nr:uridine kinase [Thiofilum flexile]
MIHQPPRFIGICGGSGSGKSTLAQAVVSHSLKPTTLISLDSYYHCKSNIPSTLRGNYDHPDTIDTPLLSEHLQSLRQGRAVDLPHYDFTIHDRSEHTQVLLPTPIIILDGILLFALPTVMKHLDLSIYVDTPSDIRLARRIQRDTRERGRTVDDILEQYFATVRPMHECYVEPYRLQADVIVAGDGELEVDTVLAAIHSCLHATTSVYF